MSTQLPYVFDLLYDIKTLEQLNDHLSGRVRYPVHASDAELYELARNNGVDCIKVPRELPEQFGICDRHLLRPEGVLCPFCRASRLEAMLVRLTRPECGVMPDLLIEIRRALKEAGYEHS